MSELSRVALPGQPDNCYLLRLPREIRDKIWNLAVLHQRHIRPGQARSMSNMFVNRNEVLRWVPRPRTHFDVGPVNFQPTAALLGLVGRQVYNEVSCCNLFYKVNTFIFGNIDHLAVYLVAITPARRKAISNIIVTPYDYIRLSQTFSRALNRHQFSILSMCDSLENLKIRLLWKPKEPYNMNVLPGMSTLRGLKTLTLCYDDDDERELQNLCDHFKKVVCKPRTAPTSRQINMFRAIASEVPLHVFGSGRLGEDVKPEMVSSRTRCQLRRSRMINEFGVIPQRELPMRDIEGQLIWRAERVLESRQTLQSDGIMFIELRIEWDYEMIPGNESWEPLEDCVNLLANVIRFFAASPNSPGIDEAISMSKMHLPRLMALRGPSDYWGDLRTDYKYLIRHRAS